MPLSFAVVTVRQLNGRFLPHHATVPGLGNIAARSREAFCKAAGKEIFETSPAIQEVRFFGPKGKETSVTRSSLEF
jgi:hypothetical protein